ncbi:MAG TPA: TPM domain-containing protein [Methylomirabilota bacterium]|jgi:uncharacterized membrane protein
MSRPPRWARRFFSGADLEAIAGTVNAVEERTAAEIRVHLERRVPRGRRAPAGDALARARDVFLALKMHETRLHGGVLIYLAVDDRQLAIIGDEGIHARVDPGYWEAVRDRMLERLRGGAARDAVLQAVEEVGAVLAREFPRRPDDVDELPDDVSLGR